MNNTIPNVPRELLERARAAVASTNTSNWSSDLLRDIHAILSAPSPAGVEGLEVAGYISQDDIKWQGDCTLRLKPYSDYTIPLCRLSDAQAIIDGLRGEVGAQRVKTCVALKERNDAREERDQLAGLLREKFPRIDPHHPLPLSEVDHCCEYVLHKDRERLHCAIDAALSAGKEGE